MPSASVCALFLPLLPLAMSVSEGVGELVAHLCREIKGRQMKLYNLIVHVPTSNTPEKLRTNSTFDSLENSKTIILIIWLQKCDMKPRVITFDN